MLPKIIGYCGLLLNSPSPFHVETPSSWRVSSPIHSHGMIPFSRACTSKFATFPTHGLPMFSIRSRMKS